ncbi:ATP-dependent 6-phosphofructokinase [Sesamum angolense]|uniref:ATP-dependent 6-phosphofructokinase n=1 Tax=Sesamum angolense TaxID=2727404 RepID=A0AAE1WNZ6_9LAMI|nr:ATP-dependent 6-phosphofructokinase [Sesamum angolense]
MGLLSNGSDGGAAYSAVSRSCSGGAEANGDLQQSKKIAEYSISGNGFPKLAPMELESTSKTKSAALGFGYVLEDVPHLSDYIPDLPTYPNPLQDHPAYSVVRRYFIDVDDTVAQKGGYRGFYSRNTISLTPKTVNDIHKRGGTILGTSRGGHNTKKIVDCIQDRGINQVYIIGGDGTQKGASVIFEEIRKRGLKVAVVGIPKTIDNDIPAVEEAQRAINAAHVEATSTENGIGLVKLMGRYSGFIAMYATLASRDVDCCLIPESPFYLEGAGGLLEYIEKRIKENGHMVIVIAEGAGQELLSESMRPENQQDASGNKLLQDVGLWISQKIKDYFSKQSKVAISLKYIDPTYMIRAIPSNASDNVYCTLLAQSAVHGAMAGYTGFTVGSVNGRNAYIPFHRITERQNKVVITDRMWARLLLSTNQPSFFSKNNLIQASNKKEPLSELLDDGYEYSSVMNNGFTC